MFGWDFENSKADRVKLFLFLFVIFLIVGFSASLIIRSLSSDANIDDNNEVTEAKGDSEADSTLEVDFGSEEPVVENEQVENEFDQTEHFSEENLEETKEIAVDFVKAYHSYDSDNPSDYLENAQPYMTEALYQEFSAQPRRETLERSYLTVKETQVTNVVNSSSRVIRWNIIVLGEAESVDGEISETEDWYLVGLRQVDGEWKVEDVRVNVPN